MKTVAVLIIANALLAIGACVAHLIPFSTERQLPTLHVKKEPDSLFPFGEATGERALKTWQVSGSLKVKLDDLVSTSPPTSFRFDNGPGQASYEMVPVNDEVELLGKLRVTNGTRGRLWVQMKDGVAPQIRLAQLDVAKIAPEPNRWYPFRMKVRFPVSYYGAQTVLQLQSGTVWLDDLEIRRRP